MLLVCSLNAALCTSCRGLHRQFPHCCVLVLLRAFVTGKASRKCLLTVSAVIDGDVICISTIRNVSSCLEHAMPGCAKLPALFAGKKDVWSYWFNQFAPQYAGLPGLGSLEDIYNSQDVSRKQFQQCALLLVIHSCSVDGHLHKRNLCCKCGCMMAVYLLLFPAAPVTRSMLCLMTYRSMT